MRLIKYIIAAEIAAVVLAANYLSFKTPILGVFFGFVYIVLLAFLWGNALGIKENFWRFFHGLSTTVAVFAAIGGLVYYFYKIDSTVIVLSLITAPLIPLIAGHFLKSTFSSPFEKENPKTKKFWLLFGLLIALLVTDLALIIKAATHASLRSPFEMLSPLFFFFYFLTALHLIVILKTRISKASLFLAIAFFFVTFSVGVIIYASGFGYDPFIHQAAEKLIIQTGQVTPKTPYYNGQYFLVVFLSQISAVPLNFIDIWLVPILASLLLPIFLIYNFRFWPVAEKSLAPFSLILLSIPFASFTLTTPQSLANLFLLATILNALSLIKGGYPWLGLIISALASFVVHPLAGLAAFIFVGILAANELIKNPVHKKIGLGLMIISGILVIPAVFYVLSLRGPGLHLSPVSDWRLIFQPMKWLRPNLARTFNFTYDLAYFFGQNIYLLFTALGLAGIFVAWKNKSIKKLSPFAFTFVVLMISYWILSVWFNFDFLIQYEKLDYARRIFEISFYFLLPLAVLFFASLMKSKSRPIQIFGCCFLSFLILDSLYFSYPRNNPYETGHDISTSRSDIKTVNQIEEKANGKDYIVLSDQSVAAGALKELGFKKYFHTSQGDVFFYPIPTGGALYEYYLKMVYDRPSRATVKAAADLAGVHEAYFVINRYWDGFERLSETAKAEADDWWNVDNQDFVYHYKF